MEASHATEEAIRQTTQAAGQAGEELAKAGEQAAHAAVSVGETAANALTQMAASSFEAVAQVARNRGDGGLPDVRPLAHNLDIALQSGAVLARGMQSAWLECLEYGQHALERNVSGLRDLAGCRSFDQALARQSDLMTENIEDWLQSSIRLCELSAQAAREAVDKIKQTTSPQH